MDDFFVLLKNISQPRGLFYLGKSTDVNGKPEKIGCLSMFQSVDFGSGQNQFSTWLRISGRKPLEDPIQPSLNVEMSFLAVAKLKKRRGEKFISPFFYYDSCLRTWNGLLQP